LFFPVWIEDAKRGVFHPSIEELANQILMFFSFIGFEPDTDKITGSGNKFSGREQTVLRLGITGSEDAWNIGTGGRCCHEENGSVRALRFFFCCFPGCVPHDTPVTDWLS